MIDTKRLVSHLELQPHPEGGFYKKTYEDQHHQFSSIIFLLTPGNFSAFHRLLSEEQWNFYSGNDLVIHEIEKNGDYRRTVLSSDPMNGDRQYVVKRGNWFASESEGNKGYSFCGCTVIPAFKFEDFVLAKRNELILQFPQHESVIRKLTRMQE